MPELMRPPVVNHEDPRFFKIMTAPLRAYKEAGKDGDKYFLEGIASSTVMDSYGDVLTETCQSQMLQRAKGMTMWLNHSYQVPEDVLGTNVEGTLVRGTSGDGTGRDDGTYGEGEGCTDLRIRVEVDQTNPRAMKAWNQVNNGIKLGFSIGGWFLDVELVDNDAAPWGFSFIVNAIDLLEISLVGLPANPRAYTKALEFVTERMRKHVLSKAEEIATEAKREAREIPTQAAAAQFVVKSMFERKEETIQECAADDCHEPCADGALVCDKHEDVGASPADAPNGGEAAASTAAASPESQPETTPPPATSEAKSLAIELNAEGWRCKACGTSGNQSNDVEEHVKACVGIAFAKELSDMQAQACISAMKFIKSAIAHGMCTQAAGDARSAHAVVKAMLPNDYDIPDDAELDDPATYSLNVDVTADTSELQAQVAELEQRASNARAEHEALTAQIAEGTAKLEQMSAERDALQQKVEQLKATPAGRSTRTSYPGGSSGNEPTADASLYYQQQSQLAATAARSTATRAVGDARARMQV